MLTVQQGLKICFIASLRQIHTEHQIVFGFIQFLRELSAASNFLKE